MQSLQDGDSSKIQSKTFRTSSLLNHLRTKHPDMYRQLKEDKVAALAQDCDEPPAIKSKTTLEIPTISVFLERSHPLQKDSDRT